MVTTKCKCIAEGKNFGYRAAGWWTQWKLTGRAFGAIASPNRNSSANPNAFILPGHSGSTKIAKSVNKTTLDLATYDFGFTTKARALSAAAMSPAASSSATA